MMGVVGAEPPPWLCCLGLCVLRAVSVSALGHDHPRPVVARVVARIHQALPASSSWVKSRPRMEPTISGLARAPWQLFLVLLLFAFLVPAILLWLSGGWFLRGTSTRHPSHLSPKLGSPQVPQLLDDHA